MEFKINPDDNQIDWETVFFPIAREISGSRNLIDPRSPIIIDYENFPVDQYFSSRPEGVQNEKNINFSGDSLGNSSNSDLLKPIQPAIDSNILAQKKNEKKTDITQKMLNQIWKNFNQTNKLK